MANHVQHVLVVTGQDVQAVRNYVQRPENALDFTTLLPLPEGASAEETIRCWGTKSNAIGAVFREEDGSFSFQTLNTAPLPVIKRLSEQFPDRTFTLYWADEGGGNCGETAYQNGYELYSFYPEDGTLLQEELYERCWGQPMYSKGGNH